MKLTQNNMRISAVAAMSVMSCHSLFAAEYTAKLDAFERSIKLEATAITEKGVPVMIKPLVWKEVKIEKFLPHGSPVEKGEKLIWIETKLLDEKIDDLRKEREKQKLILESAELELLALKTSTAEALAKAERVYDQFQEDYNHYKKVTKPVKLSDIEYSVKSATDYLSYEQEELDQLLKMYAEDGLTEETEEIIVKRTKHGVARAKRELEKAEREAEYEKNVVIPREDLDWKSNAEANAMQWEQTQKNLPLALKLKELDVDKIQRDDEKSEQQLVDLNTDRTSLEFLAPADGVVYIGEFKNGKWLHEQARKALVVGGMIPESLTMMTIVPKDAKLTFCAFLDEKQKNIFSSDLKGSVRLQSNPWMSIPAKGSLLSELPSIDQQWMVTFSTQEDLPERVKIGAKAEITMVSASKDKVLTIPVNAVESKPDGKYTVRIKMAEGEPQVINVELGRQAGDKVEVISGLKDGQVILTP